MKNLSSFFRRRIVGLWRLLAVLALIAGSASGLGLLSPGLASAASADDLRIKKLSVSVWPEYDDPRLLAIYQGEFADGGSFPRQVKFKVPKDASMNMVCALTPAGDHNCQYYETSIEGDWKIITYTLPIPTFYLEYYSASIEGATDKSVNYQFPNPPFAIDNLSIEIQQPLRTNNFLINPASINITSDSKGFRYHNYQFSNVAPDKDLSFGITYSKTDSKPSVKSAAEQQADQESQNRLITIGGVGGLIVVIVAAYFVFRKNKGGKKYGKKSQSRAPTAARQAAYAAQVTQGKSGAKSTFDMKPARPSASAIFCAKCGTKLDADDVFCYSCGQPVKGKGNATVSTRK